MKNIITFLIIGALLTSITFAQLSVKKTNAEIAIV